MTFFSILALCAFLLVLIGTRMVIPSMRRRINPSFAMLKGSEPFPTPKGGGIVLLFALIICLMVADMHYALLLSLLLLASVAFIDDFINAPKSVHIITQIMAVVVGLICFSAPIFGGIFPLWLDHLIAGLLWLGCMHLFQAMDDLDGLSAAEMISIGGGLCLLTAIAGNFPSVLSIHGLIIGSGACGFLWWSLPPAKIRLGAIGTVPSGFLLGYLLLLAIATGYYYAAILLPAYYLCDGLITHGHHLMERRKHKPLSGYYYQLAMVHKRRPQAILRSIVGMNMLLIFLAVRSTMDPDIAIFNISMGYTSVFMLLGYFAHDPHPSMYDI